MTYPAPKSLPRDDWFSNPLHEDESDDIEETKTIHQKMYEIATANYNPFSLGGSEEIQK